MGPRARRAQAAYEKAKAAAGPDARRFLRGGFFRDFFRKYPEVEPLHKRMIMVSEAVRAAGASAEAVRDLYKGQCNDPYWHGVFGGLYLPHLREAAYQPSPRGREGDARPGRAGKPSTTTATAGTSSSSATGPSASSSSPRRAAPWSRSTTAPGRSNLSDVLGRRREAYHRAPSETPQGEGAATGRASTSSARRCRPRPPSSCATTGIRGPRCIDHFFSAGTTPEDFRRGDFDELGDFVGGAFSFDASGPELRLERRGAVRAGEERVPVAVRKTIACGDGGLRVDIEIENLSGTAARPDLRVGMEPPCLSA